MKARFLALAVACIVGGVVCASASAERYIVLYKQQAVDKNAAASIAAAGGTVVASYPQIGVVIAESSKASFRDALMSDSRVDGVSATSKFGVQTRDGFGIAGKMPTSKGVERRSGRELVLRPRAHQRVERGYSEVRN